MRVFDHSNWKQLKTENGNVTTNHEIEIEVFHRRELFDLATKLAQLFVNKRFEPTNSSERSHFGHMLVRKNNQPSPIKNSIKFILNLVDRVSTIKRSHGRHFRTRNRGWVLQMPGAPQILPRFMASTTDAMASNAIHPLVLRQNPITQVMMTPCLCELLLMLCSEVFLGIPPHNNQPSRLIHQLFNGFLWVFHGFSRGSRFPIKLSLVDWIITLQAWHQLSALPSLRYLAMTAGDPAMWLSKWNFKQCTLRIQNMYYQYWLLIIINDYQWY